MDNIKVIGELTAFYLEVNPKKTYKITKLHKIYNFRLTRKI